MITSLEKIKDDCGTTKFKYIRNVGKQFQKLAKTNSVSVGPSLVSSTQRFFSQFRTQSLKINIAKNSKACLDC